MHSIAIYLDEAAAGDPDRYYATVQVDGRRVWGGVIFPPDEVGWLGLVKQMVGTYEGRLMPMKMETK